MKPLRQFRHSAQMGRMMVSLIILVLVDAGLARVLPPVQVIATSVVLAGICWVAVAWRASILRPARALRDARAALRVVERALLRPSPPRPRPPRAGARY